jgi:hypothetical protein
LRSCNGKQLPGPQIEKAAIFQGGWNVNHV